jgi:hypothetical protein
VAYRRAVDVTALAALTGVERFERACAAAWATTGDNGTEPWPDGLADVPHDLSDAVEDDLELAFALYRVMPCFANLMYVGMWGVGPDFWPRLRALLDDPEPRLANPALYWLWCGPFEGSEVEEAWREVTVDAPDLRLRRLLDVSGPVPWRLKAPLLDSLASLRPWHPHVRRAIEVATVDVYGDLDVPAARRLLTRLGDPESSALSRRLAAP